MRRHRFIVSGKCDTFAYSKIDINTFLTSYKHFKTEGHSQACGEAGRWVKIAKTGYNQMPLIPGRLLLLGDYRFAKPGYRIAVQPESTPLLIAGDSRIHCTHITLGR